MRIRSLIAVLLTGALGATACSSSDPQADLLAAINDEQALATRLMAAAGQSDSDISDDLLAVLAEGSDLPEDDVIAFADWFCSSTDDFELGGEWIIAVGDGDIVLPDTLPSDNGFLIVSLAMSESGYCPSDDQNAKVSEVIDVVIGLGVAVEDQLGG